MSRTLVRYESFDESLTNPLYGWVSDCFDGAVPPWVREVNIDKSDLKELLDIPPTTPVDNKQLPAGVTHRAVGQVQDRYKIEPKTYLRYKRNHTNRTDRDGPHEAVFSLRMEDRNRIGSIGPQKTVPESNKKKLQAIRETPAWKSTVEDGQVTFKGWMLIYEIGNRGGIRDVYIAADLRSSGAIHIPSRGVNADCV